MPLQPQSVEIANSILDRLEVLTKKGDLNFSNESLLDDFEFFRLKRQAESIADKGRSYTLLSLLQLNYDRDFVKAHEYFNKSLNFDCYDVTLWTYFPSQLAIRGFVKASHQFALKALDYVPADGTLHNAFVNSSLVRHKDGLEKCIMLYQKLYPEGSESSEKTAEAAFLLQQISQEAERFSYNPDTITDILLTVQDELGKNGYIVKSRRFFDSGIHGGLFVGYHVPVRNEDEIGQLNMLVADMFAENDWFDEKLTLMIMPE